MDENNNPKDESENMNRDETAPQSEEELESTVKVDVAELKRKEAEAAQAASQVDPVESLKQELLYQRAEFENYKKRLIREKEQSVQFANESLIAEFMNIVDLFDKAIASTPKGDDAEVKNFVMGIEMTHKELVNLLGRFQVELIGAPGETFAPELHEAISQIESPDHKSGQIVSVLHRGCRIKGRLVKPAKVVVAQ